VSSVFILIKFLNSSRSFLGGLLFSLFLSLGNATILNGAQDVLVVVLGDVGYDIFSILFGTESQVSELTALIGEQRSESLLSLHDEVGHKGGVLDGGETVTFFIGLGEHLDGDAIVVN